MVWCFATDRSGLIQLIDQIILKRILMNQKSILLAVLLGVGSYSISRAGNDTKRGQGGATELLINPWARTSGIAGASSGIIRGIESMGLNVAGLSSIRKTDINFCSASYLSGSDIHINSLGFGQKVGDNGVMGLTLSTYDLGSFEETTIDNPNGTGKTFKPQIFNFGAAYAKRFSDRISGGLLIRGISQSYNSATAFGVAVDAGIQYQTGKRKEFKFGVSLMNLGSKMQFKGSDFATRGTKQGTSYSQTIGLLTAGFDMPSMLNIGVGYDFHFDPEEIVLTPCFNFRSNSFTYDQYQVGAQASWREMFILRAGYDYQKGIVNKDESTTANLGPAFGATFQMPFTRNKTGEMAQSSDTKLEDKKSKLFSLDYSYSLTRYFGGTHRFSILLSL